VSALLDLYFEAWNETDAHARGELLSRCLAGDAELIDPTGQARGITGISRRIRAFHDRRPDTRVVRSTGIDGHHGFVRYGWDLVVGDGTTALAGTDVAEHDHDGRLLRVVMFFGRLPGAE
jgi:hypothetical protein